MQPRARMKAACLAPPFLLLVAVASVSALGIAFRSSHEALRPGLMHEHAAHSAGLLQAPTSSGVTKLASGSSSQAAKTAVYPKGDCVTECSADPAARMAHCAADPAQGIPATQCQAVQPSSSSSSAGDEEVCPSLRYPDAFNTEAYCMPRFAADCAHPDNFGCSRRCALYLIVSQACVRDAYFTSNRTFNPGCIYCNMCWDRSQEARAAAQQAPYALVWARGPTGALFVNHWLVIPKQACLGIESSTPGCTDARGEYIWANAFHEAQQLGFNYSGGPPTWGLWLNAPNRRGVHQMHIHISGWESRRSLPDVPHEHWLARRIAAAADVSRDPRAPTRVLGEGYYDAAKFARTPLGRPPRNWARAYVVFVPTRDAASDLGGVIKPFELARAIAAASDLPYHSYGIALMPRTLQDGQPGLLVAAVWSTSDSEQLDETELPGDPIRYSHTCHQYISSRQQQQQQQGTMAAAMV